MRCNSSKFLLVSILTFAVGIGIVQVWQDLTQSKQLSETENQITLNTVTSENIYVNKSSPCDEIEKIPLQKRPINKNSDELFGWVISLGVINHRLCFIPLPFLPIDKEKEVEGIDYIIVKVTVDKNGFIRVANSATKSDFAKRAIKFSKRLRMPPVKLSGKPFVGIGVLVFYPEHGLPKS